jgi:lysophospholipase L1-like esterase
MTGNDGFYSVKEAVRKSSPLAGKRLFFLGSSVTAGLFSEGEAVPEYLAALDGMTCLKDAVSGTTLRQKEIGDDSYLSRLESGKILSPKEKADAFVCQLSTNDAWTPEAFGELTEKDQRSLQDFDPRTTLGALESILVLAQRNWSCPVYFYTGSFYSDLNGKAYGLLVSRLKDLARKWDLPLIDLWSDAEFNSRLPLPRSLLMHDGVHPYRAGYELWWTPFFEDFLKGRLSADGKLR